MKSRKFTLLFFASVLSLLIAGCSELLQMIQSANIQKPKVQVAKVNLTALNFNQANLTFRIKIENPNDLSISLKGFDYNLLINKHAFLKGQKNETVTIQPQGTSYVQVPVTITFKQLYQTFKSLQKADSLNYTLKTGLTFALPILGKVRIPAQTSGRLPTLKMPKLAVKSLKLEKLGFTKAKLHLQLTLNNPNAWGATLKNLNYRFAVNGLQWIEGQLNQGQTIGPKQKNVLDIPITLNLLQMGQAIYRLLTNPGALNYELQGQAKLQSTIKVLGHFNLPIDQKGTIQLVK